MNIVREKNNYQSNVSRNINYLMNNRNPTPGNSKMFKLKGITTSELSPSLHR